MNQITNLVDALYTRFVLRDLFGKIVPGMIIIVAAAVSLTSLSVVLAYLQKMSGWVWITLFGVSWLVGFIPQTLGTVPRIIRHYPYKPFKNNDAAWYQFVLQFARVANSMERQVEERFSVILEARGNGCIAVALASSVLLLDSYMEAALPFGSWLECVRWNVLPWFAGGLAASALLFCCHGKHVEREHTWMKEVLEYHTVENGPICQLQ